MTTLGRSVAGLALVSLLGLSTGCQKAVTTFAGPPELGSVQMAGAGGPAKEFDATTPPHVAGKKALVANNCFRCHAVNGARAGGGGGAPGGPPGGPGGPPAGAMMGGGRGPDLGSVGKDSEHTVDWIMKFVRDPKSVKPEARMPAQSRISDEDLRAVAEYLASLK